MTWALIEGGKVAEITQANPAGRFHESLVWVECTPVPNVEVGWVYEKGSFSPPEPTATVQLAPTSCTPAQGLVALFALKQITEEHVLEAIAQIPDPVQQYTARIGYQHATVWERGSPTMTAMARLLQLSSEDLDELFAYAVTVQV